MNTVHKGIHFRAAALFQGFIQPRLGQGKFIVAGREFLQTFQVGAQRVCLLHYLLFIFAM